MASSRSEARGGPQGETRCPRTRRTSSRPRSRRWRPRGSRSSACPGVAVAFVREHERRAVDAVHAHGGDVVAAEEVDVVRSDSTMKLTIVADRELVHIHRERGATWASRELHRRNLEVEADDGDPHQVEERVDAPAHRHTRLEREPIRRRKTRVGDLRLLAGQLRARAEPSAALDEPEPDVAHREPGGADEPRLRDARLESANANTFAARSMTTPTGAVGVTGFTSGEPPSKSNVRGNVHSPSPGAREAGLDDALRLPRDLDARAATGTLPSSEKPAPMGMMPPRKKPRTPGVGS